MRDSDRRCWVRQPPQTVANPRSDVTAQHSLAAQLSRRILFHPSLHGVAATDRCPSGQHRRSVQADGWFHRGKLATLKFIRAGVFMCRHIHREGNGGPFLFPCTADSTAATCVRRISYMTHSTQLTIPAMHAHIKATESVILMLSLSTGSRTLRPRPHTHAMAQAAVTRSTRHIHRHNHCIRSTRYISRTPSSRHAHGASTTTPGRSGSKPSSIHDAAQKPTTIPPSMGHEAQLNAVTRGVPHPQERRLGLRTPSPPFSSWPRKKTTAATRNCQHAPQKKHSNPLQCASCVCLQKHKERKQKKEEAEYAERHTKMYSRGAWRKQQIEEDRSNS
ncbi:hypothetical protein TcCL_NonESM12167 [Trypanosoma cruzi]|nr:hypothetical protein TcCL_NonESM12167 [Trypanosoma cruzi]